MPKHATLDVTGKVPSDQLPTSSGGGGSTRPAGLATITVPHNSASHSQTVTVEGALATDTVTIQLAPHADNAENDPTMLSLVSATAVAGVGNITITAEFSEPSSGPIIFNYSLR